LGVKVVINDRTEAVPAGVRTYAERKLDRLARHFDRVLSAEVEFCQDARRFRNGHPPYTVQITVHMDGRRHPLATAHEMAPRPRVALDLALDKVDRQVVRLKEKIKGRKRPALAERLREADGPVRQNGGLRRRPLQVQPMTLEQAESQLRSAKLPFFLFREEDSGDLRVCYRRPDGGLSVIEPI
jgi:ribosome hibernation promoting factor